MRLKIRINSPITLRSIYYRVKINYSIPNVLPDDFSRAIDYAIVTSNMLILSYWPFGRITDYCTITVSHLNLKASFQLLLNPVLACMLAKLTETTALSQLMLDFKTSVAAINVIKNRYISHLI